MTVWGIITLILGSEVTVRLVEAVIAFFRDKRNKKQGKKDRLDELVEKVDKLTAHDDEQYKAILQLKIISKDMPMSERLMAGKTYIEKGWNGDVRKIYEGLEAACNNAS